MDKFLLRAAIIGATSALVGSTAALAQDPPGPTRIYVKQPGDTSTIDGCNKQYFPLAENRILSDMPVTVLISQDSDSDKPVVGPAAGLDVYAVWIKPARPKCIIAPGDGTKAIAPFEGFTFSIPVGFNAAYAVFPTPGEVTVTTEDAEGDTATETVEVTTADYGAYLSLQAGAMVSINWDGGGHGNHVSLGVLGRFGYFISSEDPRWLWTVGPAVSIGIY